MNERRHVQLSSDSRLPAKIRRAIEAEVERVNAHFGHDDPRHVLIIGGAGYVGGPVTSHLLRSGMRVRVLDQLIYGHGAAVSGFLLHPDYSFIRGDMGDPAAMNTALDGITDVVILSGLVGDPITKSFPEESHRINDIALWQCIDQLNGRGLNKVIFISTCSNYGLIGDGEVADEGFELNPLSLYAKSKVAAEQSRGSRARGR